MKNKLAKSMSMIIAIAMLISMVPAVVSADTVTPSVNIDSVVVNGDTVTVTYDAAGLSEYTLLAVRDTKEYASVSDLPAEDTALELQIEYIDQPVLSADAENATVSFKLRDRAEQPVAGRIINVLLGGEGVDTPAVASGKKLISGGEITPVAEEYFSDEKIVFNVYGVSAGFDDGEVYVNGELDEDADLSIAFLKISSADNVTKVEVKHDDYEPVVWTGTITVKDRMETAKALVGNARVAYDTDEDSEIEEGKATITIPADVTNDAATGVNIAYTLKKGEDPVDVSELVATVDRPGEGSEPDVYTLVATISYTGLDSVVVEKSVSVRAVGADGPAIADTDVVFANWEGDVYTDVYGVEGANIIEIAKGELDPTKDGIEVNGTAFFYSPVREKYIGVIAGYSDAATLIADIEVTTPAPKYIYYGTVSDPTHEYWLEGDGVVLGDVMAALRLKNGITDGVSIETFLSADVIQDGEILLGDVMQVLQGKNGLRETFDIEADAPAGE